MTIYDSHRVMDSPTGACRKPVRRKPKAPDVIRTFISRALAARTLPIRTLVPSALLAMMSASSWPSAQAHDLLQADWCLDPNTVPVIVSSSVLTPETLTEFSKGIRQPSGDCPSGQTCGMVDEWLYASLAVKASCPQTVTIGSTVMQPQPIVIAPDVFNSINHHDEYQFIDGDLHVACVVCVPASQDDPVKRSGH